MTGVELKVQSYNPLTAEEARELYALYVQRGARLTASEARAERYRGALEKISKIADYDTETEEWVPVDGAKLARSALADAPGGEGKEL